MNVDRETVKKRVAWAEEGSSPPTYNSRYIWNNHTSKQEYQFQRNVTKSQALTWFHYQKAFQTVRGDRTYTQALKISPSNNKSHVPLSNKPARIVTAGRTSANEKQLPLPRFVYTMMATPPSLLPSCPMGKKWGHT